jgi:GH3 auxin-responsive promoter
VTQNSHEEALELLESFLQPWYAAVEAPTEAQRKVLSTLLKGYAKTEYGKTHGAEHVESIDDYRRAFPVITYEDCKPLIQRVMAGETGLLLNEEPIGWAITRGTTGDESKFIPMTPTDLQMRVSAGRAMLHYVVSNRCYEVLEGANLNLNFPSVVGTVQVGEKELEYGYSSGIYLKHVSAFTPIRSVPTQEEIDALGGSKSIRAWEARFELAYQKCKDDIWKVRVMTLGSVPGINTREEPALRALYGPVAIREIYGATEGMFGQQRDPRRAWVPNYDQFFFEVQTRRGIKLLHEMKAGELGSLIVSTPVLARYKIGDMILAVRPPYFRCIGRDRWWTPLDYAWGELMTFNLGRL